MEIPLLAPLSVFLITPLLKSSYIDMGLSVDPRLSFLFDPYADIFSPLGLKRIADGWQGVFLAMLLELMPVKTLGKHFHPTLGRPCKELYSVAGLIFLQENFGWTNDDATDKSRFTSRKRKRRTEEIRRLSFRLVLLSGV